MADRGNLVLRGWRRADAGPASLQGAQGSVGPQALGPLLQDLSVIGCLENMNASH